MNDYKKLAVWSRSMSLATEVYKLTSHFPSDEKYGLSSQIKRSAVSVPSNIAEGAGRESKKEFGHFLSIALGSAFELETQLLLSEKLNFIEKEILDHYLVELDSICKMIHSLRKTLL